MNKDKNKYTNKKLDSLYQVYFIYTFISPTLSSWPVYTCTMSDLQLKLELSVSDLFDFPIDFQDINFDFKLMRVFT